MAWNMGKFLDRSVELAMEIYAGAFLGGASERAKARMNLWFFAALLNSLLK